MRWKFAGALALFSLGCSVPVDDGADELESAASGPRPLSVGDAVGRVKKTFAAAGGVTEVCIIAKHFDEAGFSAKDTKKEDKLCTLDWYAAPGAGANTPAALLPKANSTNPATDLYEVTPELSRAAIETLAQANAGSRRTADKLARFKSSLEIERFNRTSSYAPSIIGYYGTSRLLSGAAEIAPAVWRTMELKRHAKVAEMGGQLTSTGSQIVKLLWRAFAATDAAPKGDLTYTADRKQVYGALITKVSGDEKDKNIDTAALLGASDRFAKLVSPATLGSLVKRDLASAAQAIVPMQGVAEMLVLDALMLQSDRLSGDNVSYVPYVYFAKDGGIDRMTQKDFDKAKAAGNAPAGAVPVKKLFLNDVDAGFIDHNATTFQKTSEFKLLQRISHISPSLYRGTRKLATLVGTPAFESFVKSEWRFTDNDFIKYKTMTGVVAKLLRDRCTAGALYIDLDVASHVAGKIVQARESCD